MDRWIIDNLWLVPTYALFGGLLALLWSPAFIRRTGPRPAGYFNILSTGLAFLHSAIALPLIWNRPEATISFNWLDAAGLNVDLDLKASVVNVGTIALISGITFLAQLFAVGYMEMDWGWARFYSLLGLFEGGMCLLVLCDSAFFSYIVLEILTLGTYLLVGLWFSQPLVVTGARDAFLTKRVGDLVLLMGVVALLPIAGTWNFTDLAEWAKTAELDPTVATLLGLALVAGPIGKCAQIPLHLWLDEAMEGPLPASILRNAVVVPIGAWVLVKFQPIVALSPVAVTVEWVVGLVTALLCSAIAIAQIDIKRVMSYATSTYMGLVFVAIGFGQSDLALLLCFTYSVAMVLLSMSIGCVISNCVTQDVTQLGGLWPKRPAAGPGFLVGMLGLVAVPPLGCFWALSALGGALLEANQPLIFAALLLINAMTGFSLMRTFGLVFFGSESPMTQRAPEVLWPMSFPTLVMVGVVLHTPLLLIQWQILPSLGTTEAIALGASSLVGLGSAAALYLNPQVAKPIHSIPAPIRDFFAYDLYTAKLYRNTIVLVVGAVSGVLFWIDRFIVDGFVNAVGALTVVGGQGLRYNTTGQVQFYALSILLGVVLFGALVAWPILAPAVP